MRISNKPALADASLSELHDIMQALLHDIKAVKDTEPQSALNGIVETLASVIDAMIYNDMY